MISLLQELLNSTKILEVQAETSEEKHCKKRENKKSGRIGKESTWKDSKNLRNIKENARTEKANIGKARKEEINGG